MSYEMTPEERALNDEANAGEETLDERIERAIVADYIFVITATNPFSEGHIILLSRVGEVETKMPLTTAQAQSMVEELQAGLRDIARANLRKAIIG